MPRRSRRQSSMYSATRPAQPKWDCKGGSGSTEATHGRCLRPAFPHFMNGSGTPGCPWKHRVMGFETFRRYFLFTRHYIRQNLYFLIVLNVVAAGIESIGILLFLPFITQITGGTTQQSPLPFPIPASLGGLL